MEEFVETTVLPETVWAAWEKIHSLEVGKGKAQGHQYQILNVKRGESFTILWKSLFARLVFLHSVQPAQKGARICYSFEIRGPFSWLLRKMLEKKIRKNLATVLQALVKQLES